MRRRITTVVEETVSAGNQMDVVPGRNTQLPMLSGTCPSENTPTQVMPVVTCEQSSNQGTVGPFPEQLTSSALTAPSGDDPGVLVSVRKKGRYEGHDRVDQYLLLQVSGHVRSDTVELLAAHLGVSEEQYVDTRTAMTTQPSNPRAQVMKVSVF